MSPSGRLSGSLPVSIGAHCVAIGVLLVAPLTTDLTVPGLITRAPSLWRQSPYARRRSSGRQQRQLGLVRRPITMGRLCRPPNPGGLIGRAAVPDVPVGDVSASMIWARLSKAPDDSSRRRRPCPAYPDPFASASSCTRRGRSSTCGPRTPRSRVRREWKGRSFSRRFSTAMAASIEHESRDRFRCSTLQRWMRCGSGGTRQPY